MKTCAAVLATVLSLAGWADEKIQATKPLYGDGSWWLTGANWESNAIPDDQHDYLLGSKSKTTDKNDYNMRFGSSGDGATFTGRSLQIGEVGGRSILLIDAINTALTFPHDGLILANGTLTSWYNNTAPIIIGGTVTVIAPASKPFTIQAAKPTTTVTLTDKLVGASGTKINLTNGANLLQFVFGFDASEFFGEIEYVPGETQPRATIASTDFAGKVTAPGVAFTLNKDASATFANMSLSGNTTLTVANDGSIGGTRQCGKLTVTNEFSLTDRMTVTLSPSCNTWKQGTDGHTVFPSFLTVPVGSDVDLDSFVCTQASNAGVFYPTFEINVATNETAGTKSFSVVRRSYYQVEVSSTYGYDPNDSTRFVWTGNYDAEGDYFSKMSDGRTFESPSAANLTFGGRSFTVASDPGQTHALRVRTPDITFDDLRMGSGAQIYSSGVYGGGSVYVLRGGLMLFKTPREAETRTTTEFHVGGGWLSMEVASTITGSGDAALLGGEKGTHVTRTLLFSGDNSAWTGGMLLAPASENAAIFGITRKEALGGALPEFRYDALTFGEHAILRPWADGIVLDDRTRGVYVNATRAVVDVPEGMTFGIDENVAFNGTLAKTGAGTLQLGGTGRIASEAEDPRDSVLSVEAGAVQPLTTDCLAGIPLAFSNTGCLGFSPAADPSEGVETLGLVDPVLVDGALLTAKVLLSEETLPGPGGVAVPICTMTTSAKADAIRNRIKLLKPWKGFKATLSEKANGDGSVTFIANVIRSGFFVIVK